MITNCDDLLSNLQAYLDDEASPELKAEIERHLATCENCRVVVDTVRKTVELVHSLPSPTLTEDAKARLYQRLALPRASSSDPKADN